MSCVDIRGCRIGEGRPKVILPIVERAEAAILEKAAQFSTIAGRLCGMARRSFR